MTRPARVGTNLAGLENAIKVLHRDGYHRLHSFAQLLNEVGEQPIHIGGSDLRQVVLVAEAPVPRLDSGRPHLDKRAH